MHKSIYTTGFLIISLLLSNLAEASTANEKSSADIYSSSMPYVDINTEPKAEVLSIYISLGCNHCIRFLYFNLDWIITLVENKKLNLRILEIPKKIGYWKERSIVAAGKNSMMASFFTQCVAEKLGGKSYLYKLDQLGKLLRHNVINKKSKKSSKLWEWYVYANKNDLSSSYSSVPDMLKRLLTSAGINENECNKSGFSRFVKESNDVLKRDTKSRGVPTFIFQGKSYKGGESYDLYKHVIKYVKQQGGDNEKVLAKIRDPEVASLVDLLVDKFYASSVRSQLIKIGVPAIPALVNVLGDKNRRAAASVVLSRIGIPALDYLLKASVDKKKLGAVLYILQVWSKKGNAVAQFHLGNFYANRADIKRDYKEAFKWFEKSAKQGHMGSQNALGVLYYQGYGVAKDYQQAFIWYTKAANGGDTSAQSNLGDMYLGGNGVKKDYSKALEWYRKSATQGNAIAQYRMGYSYEHGNLVNKDFNQAVYWYKKSANQGYTVSQNKLSIFYEKGHGVKQNYKSAFFWAQESAKRGNISAIYRMGYLYENGVGINRDIKKASRWYLKAARQGHNLSKKALKRIMPNKFKKVK